MPTNQVRTPGPGCARPLVSAGRSPSGADCALSSGDGPEATGAKKAEARTLPRCAGSLPWGSTALAEVYAQDGASWSSCADDGQRERPPSPRVELAALAPQRFARARRARAKPAAELTSVLHPPGKIASRTPPAKKTAPGCRPRPPGARQQSRHENN